MYVEEVNREMFANGQHFGSVIRSVASVKEHPLFAANLKRGALASGPGRPGFPHGATVSISGAGGPD